MGQLCELAFQTDELSVFLCVVQPSRDHVPRDYFLAFRRHEDHPIIVATATVGPSFHSDFTRNLDAINLVSDYGTIEHGVELWNGVEKFLEGDLAPLYAVGEIETSIAEARNTPADTTVPKNDMGT